jgi:hypothetical protein
MLAGYIKPPDPHRVNHVEIYRIVKGSCLINGQPNGQ